MTTPAQPDPNPPAGELAAGDPAAVSGTAGQPVVAEPVAHSDRDDLGPLLRWVADHEELPSIQLMCYHDGQPVPKLSDFLTVRLDCAADLTPVSYLEAVATGIPSLEVLTEGCPQAARVQSAVTAANDLLAACPGAAPLVRCQPSTPRGIRHRTYELHHLPLSRRRLLMPTWRSKVWLPDTRTSERARMIAALRVLMARATAPATLHELPAPAAILSADGCTACGVCVRACPVGALQLSQPAADGTGGTGTGGAFTLAAFASACTDCGRCVEMCPAKIMARTGQRNWDQVIRGAHDTIAAGASQRCARCGDIFTGTGKLCPPCQFRADNPFGSWVPDPSQLPGFAAR